MLKMYCLILVGISFFIVGCGSTQKSNIAIPNTKQIIDFSSVALVNETAIDQNLPSKSNILTAPAIILPNLTSEEIKQPIFNNRWTGKIIVPAGSLTKTTENAVGEFYKSENGYYEGAGTRLNYNVGIFVPKDKNKPAVLYVYHEVLGSTGYDFGKDPVMYKSKILEAKKSSTQIENKVQTGSSSASLTKPISTESGSGARLDIRASVTTPDAQGDFIINIQTSTDTASLKVDDEEQGANKTGIYTIRRVARVGVVNRITITARDIYGNTDTKTISVARQAMDSRPTFARLNPANIKPQPARDAVAIIIGIQNYKLIPKAEFANQDAQVFYDYASRALGIQQGNIKLLVDDDADVSGIYKAFQNWLPLKVRKGKTDVYVFYSGHGLPSADGKSLYFLPVGADRDLIAKTAISQKEIVDALKAAQPKSVTMFIDSCYSGQIRTGETLLASARPVVLTVRETAYPPEFTVITASASDQIASSSPDLKHGIFSYYLMKGLEGEADENKDGTITIGKLQSYLAERVPRFAMTMSRKQEPQLTGDVNRVLVAQ